MGRRDENQVLSRIGLDRDAGAGQVKLPSGLYQPPAYFRLVRHARLLQGRRQPPQVVSQADGAASAAASVPLVLEQADGDCPASDYVEGVDDVVEAEPGRGASQRTLGQLAAVEGAAVSRNLLDREVVCLSTRFRCSHRCRANGAISSSSVTRSSARSARPSSVLASASCRRPRCGRTGQQSTASRFAPVSSDAKAPNGPHVQLADCDEVASHKTSEVYDVPLTAMGKRRHPLLSISTATGNSTGIGR